MIEEDLDRISAGTGLLPWEADALTFGELKSRVEGMRERERRYQQGLAIIAYEQAGVIARALSGAQVQEVYELFPFWSEEEVREMKLEKYRRIMERYAAAGKGGV